MVLRGWWGRWCQKFYWGGSLLLGDGNPKMSDFDHSNIFQSLKQLSVNTERQLKSKLA